MNLTDPISNALTIIRNGNMAKKIKADIPFSKISEEILNILKREKFIKDFKGIKVHLTVYGIDFRKKTKELKSKRDILLIVGGEKVPAEIYKMADYNLSISNQPQSEIGALAIFLYELFDGKFKNIHGRINIIESEKGKIIEKS